MPKKAREYDLELGAVDDGSERERRQKAYRKFKLNTAIHVIIILGGLVTTIISLVKAFGGPVFASSETFFAILTAILGAATTIYGTWQQSKIISAQRKNKKQSNYLAEELERATKERLSKGKLNKERLNFAPGVEEELAILNSYVTTAGKVSIAFDGMVSERHSVVKRAADKFIRDNPNDLKAFFIRFQAHYFMGELELALKDVKHYLVYIHSDFALLLKGNIYRALGNQEENVPKRLDFYQKAKKIFEGILKKNKQTNLEEERASLSLDNNIRQIFFIQVVKKDLGRIIAYIAESEPIYLRKSSLEEANNCLTDSLKQLNEIDSRLNLGADHGFRKSIRKLIGIVQGNQANILADFADIKNIEGAAYKEVEKLYKDITDLCEEILKMDLGETIIFRLRHNLATYYKSFGDLHKQWHNFREARACYSQSIDIYTKYILDDVKKDDNSIYEYSDEQKARFYYYLGYYYLQLARTYQDEKETATRKIQCTQALANFEHALECNQHNLLAHLGIVNTYILQASLNSANRKIDEALKLNFNNDSNIGYLYVRKAYILSLNPKSAANRKAISQYLDIARRYVDYCSNLNDNILEIENRLREQEAKSNKVPSPNPKPVPDPVPTPPDPIPTPPDPVPTPPDPIPTPPDPVPTPPDPVPTPPDPVPTPPDPIPKPEPDIDHVHSIRFKRTSAGAKKSKKSKNKDKRSGEPTHFESCEPEVGRMHSIRATNRAESTYSRILPHFGLDPNVRENQKTGRGKLFNQKIIKQKLANRVPSRFQWGAANGHGDCFFDSMALALNHNFGNQNCSMKALRQFCFSYANNPNNSWVRDAIKADKDIFNFDEYLERIKFTGQEIDEKYPGLMMAVWGRSDIEGRMMCEHFNVRLHVIEILDQPVDGTDIVEAIVDAQGSKSVTSVNNPSIYDEPNVLHLVVHKDHYIPLYDPNVEAHQQSAEERSNENARSLSPSQ